MLRIGVKFKKVVRSRDNVPFIEAEVRIKESTTLNNLEILRHGMPPAEAVDVHREKEGGHYRWCYSSFDSPTKAEKWANSIVTQIKKQHEAVADLVEGMVAPDDYEVVVE